MEKKKNFKTIFLLQISVIAVFVLLALGSASQDVADFQKGFRDGWNSTAPEEYRY